MNTQFHPATSTGAYLAQIPADVQLRAADYTHGGHWIVLFSALVGVAINLLILRLRWLSRLRWRARAGLVFAVYYLLAWTLDLPWAMYAHWWRERHYGLSQQGLGAWLSESLISACFSAVLLAVVAMLMYALMRRAPRTWWIWSGGVTSAMIIAVTALAPVVIEPVFNQFQPLPAGSQRDAIGALARQAGIPAGQIISYDGSKQSSRYTAHVSGLGGSARIAVSDALLAQASEAELRAVVGHEIGHYVMHHELWLAFGYSALLTFAFWMLHRLYVPLARLLGAAHAGPLSDPAGLPLLSIILTLSFLLFTPITNGMTRLIENQADVYSLEHAREPQGMALALLRTADYRAADPGLLEEWLFYDHPSIARRIQRALDWQARH
ncbi:STE24 endopeptidase [Duganella sp. SG902]|uniref:M48 family metalloprotease n=1 Tax=Duganella sp. SG902 TaxID=2587016 RepID=UPI00159D5C3F|nr:M48 family metalloprotease [Duganella sp. SG902]NVM77713.1 STE24 endopeptidase [Duganella sp. SG902]